MLQTQGKQHKINMIGREYQSGNLELLMKVEFATVDRSAAANAFDELKRDGFLQGTFTDMIDPENWVEITELGREHLQRNLKDRVDLSLEAISPHLVELRQGMHDAVMRTSPDAARQAAHGARELIDQVLKEGAPSELKTRRERFRFMMEKSQSTGEISQTDLALVEANWKVVDAELNKLMAASHARGTPLQREVSASIKAIERILSLLFSADG